MKRRELLKAAPLTIASIAAAPLSALIITPKVQAATVPPEVRDQIIKEYREERNRIIMETLTTVNSERQSDFQRRVEFLDFQYCPEMNPVSV